MSDTSEARPRTIADLCMRSHLLSKEKGWYSGHDRDPRSLDVVTDLFHSEVSEALEEWRANRGITETYFEVTFREDGKTWAENVPEASVASVIEATEDGKLGRGREFVKAKPMGVPPEVADIAIRVAQWVAGTAVDAELASRTFERLVQQAPDPVVLSSKMFSARSSGMEAGSFSAVLAALHVSFSMALLCGTSVSWSVLMDVQGMPASTHAWLAYSMRVLFDFANRSGLDLWAAIEVKEDYNRGRSFRHGGKRA